MRAAAKIKGQRQAPNSAGTGVAAGSAALRPPSLPLFCHCPPPGLAQPLAGTAPPPPPLEAYVAAAAARHDGGGRCARPRRRGCTRHTAEEAGTLRHLRAHVPLSARQHHHDGDAAKRPTSPPRGRRVGEETHRHPVHTTARQPPVATRPPHPPATPLPPASPSPHPPRGCTHPRRGRGRRPQTDPILSVEARRGQPRSPQPLGVSLAPPVGLAPPVAKDRPQSRRHLAETRGRTARLPRSMRLEEKQVATRERPQMATPTSLPQARS